MNTIYVKRYPEADFPINEREIWRYSGYLGIPKADDGALREELEQVKELLKNAFSYKVCYRRMSVSWDDLMPILPFKSESKALARCLEGSDEIVMFAATIGLDIDRYIARYEKLSPVKALLMQAYGAERVEALCDAFCDEIKAEVLKENKTITPRFSPGYGDLPLETQKEFFRVLDCSRQIGISLGNTLLMTPSKSVTAIFGIKQKDSIEDMLSENKACTQSEHNKCSSCDNKFCDFRQE